MNNLTIDDIKALAVKSETEIRPVSLGFEELTRKRELILSYLDEGENDDEEFAQLRREYNERKKDRSKTLKNLRTEARRKSEEREVKVYHVPDYETGMMQFFDETGQSLGSRRLTPEERQTTIHDITNVKAA